MSESNDIEPNIPAVEFREVIAQLLPSQRDMLERMERVRRGEYIEGPWTNEPKSDNWVHKGGYPCAMRRIINGGWGGYVCVPPGHPYHGRETSEVDLQAEGGVVFAAEVNQEPNHLGAAVGWWVFGFDAGHGWDWTPEMATMGHPQVPGHTYKDFDYMRDQVVQLAEQLRKVGHRGSV